LTVEFSYTFTNYNGLFGPVDSAESFRTAISGIENLDGSTGYDRLTGDNNNN
jgi:hypothetical protein